MFDTLKDLFWRSLRPREHMAAPGKQRRESEAGARDDRVTHRKDGSRILGNRPIGICELGRPCQPTVIPRAGNSEVVGDCSYFNSNVEQRPLQPTSNLAQSCERQWPPTPRNV